MGVSCEVLICKCVDISNGSTKKIIRHIIEINSKAWNHNNKVMDQNNTIYTKKIKQGKHIGYVCVGREG